MNQPTPIAAGVDAWAPVDEQSRVEAARPDKLTALHDQLAEQVAALRTGADWQRWLAVAARFHAYSFQNTLLILRQRPAATTIAGYQTWKGLGRQVTKGEKGIAILAPILRRPAAEPDQPDEAPSVEVAGETTGRRVAGYRIAYVWDLSQTVGDPLPEHLPPGLLEGAAPEGLWDSLADLVAAQGYQLTRGDCGGANGVTDFAAKTVRVREDVEDGQAVKTLAHELAHIRLHATGFEPGQARCRGAVEVEAESVAYLVAAVHGMTWTENDARDWWQSRDSAGLVVRQP